MTIDRVDHVLLAVRDLEKATETYTRMLGRDPSWRGTHANGTANTLFRLANTDLELLAPDPASGDGTWLEARLEEKGEGPLALAFGTSDAKACCETLRANGIDAGDPVAGVDGSGERAFTTVAIPTDATRGVSLFAIEHTRGRDAVRVTEPVGRGTVTKVDHVVVQTPDPEAAIRLYGQQLGLRLALDRTFEERGVRLLFFRVGGFTVEIGTSAQGGAPDDRPDLLWGVAFGVDDADATHARLSADGFDMTNVRPGNKKGTRVCTVKGPTHGVPTLMIEPVPE